MSHVLPGGPMFFSDSGTLKQLWDSVSHVSLREAWDIFNT